MNELNSMMSLLL